MRALGFSLFDTAMGRCAVAWSANALVAVQLPEPTDAGVRTRMKRRIGDAPEATPPAFVAAWIADIQALLAGERRDLAHVRLDLAGAPPFHQRIYAAARAIPPGQTRTYGELAAAVGEPGAARAVGQAMGRNPCPIVIPCHRVTAAGGKTGGFSAPGGVDTKLRMLTIERAADGEPALFGDLPLMARRKR
jgi:methylated-DNA-[protein]-cysteine S-methyltransferase